MARVEIIVEETLVETKGGQSVEGICVSCCRCEHMVEVAGVDCVDLRKQAIRLLHKTCPEREDNSYFVECESHQLLGDIVTPEN